MDRRFKSIIISLILLLLLFVVSEARSFLQYASPEKREVNGIFRTLKGSKPSHGNGHRAEHTHSLGAMKDSGPSSGGGGHLIKTAQQVKVVKNSGPSPGQGH